MQVNETTANLKIFQLPALFKTATQNELNELKTAKTAASCNMGRYITDNISYDFN